MLKKLSMSNTMFIGYKTFIIHAVFNLLNHDFSINISNLNTYYQIKVIYLIIKQSNSRYIQHIASQLTASVTNFLPIDRT